MKRKSLSVWFFSAGLLICVSASAERLLSPWESSRPKPTDASYTCPAPPAFSRLPDPQGYYTDKQSTKIFAPGWGTVGGKLTLDRSQIDWSNGTYWARCPATPAPSPLSLTGKWYADGGVQPCFIQQMGDQVSISHGKGCEATGQIDAAGHLTTEWSGNRIEGAVTPDGNHINWDNQTYWSRAKIYEPPRK